MKKPNITIIILHFSKWRITKNCLDSLSKISHPNFNYQVILINNSLKNIHSHPLVSLSINPQKNLGFAAGNNLGIEKSQTFKPDYFLFLNNDTIVEPDFLKNLIRDLPQTHALAGPILEHLVNQKTFYDYGGFIDWPKTQAKHCNKANYKKGSPQLRDFVSGCCLLISSHIIKQIGGFKSKYFLYLEDVELCLRAKKNQYPTYIIPSAKIHHLGSQSSTEFKKIFYSLRNSLYLISDYAPKKYKLSSYLFNLSFYPAILISWQLKRLKRFIFH